jgi:NADPH2:quinone reductase
MKELFALHAEGVIKPHISEVFPFDDYVKALNVLSERRATGKIVLRVS